MAGKGSRFQECGQYSHPKPLIEVNNKPMIQLVIENFARAFPVKANRKAKFIFICQEEHYKDYDLYNVFDQSLKSAGASDYEFEVVKIQTITQGAACTALMAKDFIDPVEPLIIANSDQYVDQKTLSLFGQHTEESRESSIICFKSTHPKWSYVRVEAGKIIEVAEKKVISDNATAGIYHFAKGYDFVRATEAMIQKDIRTKGEFYIAPCYNELILEGDDIYPYMIPNEDFHGLGTPEDLKSFLALS